jgi:hypothetical protein
MTQKPDTTRAKGKGAAPAKPLAKGFVQAGGLLGSRITESSKKRGFAETRLLTHWAEIVGAETAAIARPMNVSHSVGGMGATLTLLTSGAQAPELQMQLPAIKDRVNACYGYSAISRIRITQTAASGFGEEPVAFQHREPDVIRDESINLSLAEIGDPGLRQALDMLGRNILAKAKTTATRNNLT